MRKTTKMKLSAILGAAAFLFVGGAFLATNETKATAEDATPTLTFKAGNVNFGDDVHTLFAVDAQNVGEAEVKVLLWNSSQAEYTVGTEDIILDDQGTVDINETTCLKYTYEGLGAHEMTKNLYARAYAVVDGVACYSDPLKYSVLQYAYNKMGKTDATASTNQDYIDLLQAMLNYGGAVQTYTNQNTDRLANADYTYVKLTNAKFEDGFTKGLYLPSEEVKIIPEEGYKLSINAGSAFEDNGDGTVTLKVPENNVTSEDLFVEEGTQEEEIIASQYYLRTETVDSNGVKKTYFAGEISGSELILSETATTKFNFEWTNSDKTEFYLSYGDETPTYVVYSGSGTALSMSNTATSTWTFVEAGGKTVIAASNDTTRYLGATTAFSGVKAYAMSNVNTYAPIFNTEDTVVDTSGNDEIKVGFEKDALVDISLTGGDSTTLKQAGSTYGDVTIEWEVTEDAGIATISGNTLQVENPAEETVVTLTASVSCGEIVDTKIIIVTVTPQSTSTEPVETILATFSLGANGTASHADSSKELTTYTETVNGYTLNLASGSKMYPSSRDAKGNGCIKFGSSSAAGKFTLTVPADVTKVVLYVAGYKANTAKVQINGGTTQTISEFSNNGAYTAIEIDTTSNKTVTFATVSGGYRAMLNTIEFIGMA